MKLYKDGMEIQADKEQLKLMLDAGWSLNAVEPEEPPSEDIVVEEKVLVEEEKIQIKPKKTRKPKKISIK